MPHPMVVLAQRSTRLRVLAAWHEVIAILIARIAGQGLTRLPLKHLPWPAMVGEELTPNAHQVHAPFGQDVLGNLRRVYAPHPDDGHAYSFLSPQRGGQRSPSAPFSQARL